MGRPRENALSLPCWQGGWVRARLLDRCSIHIWVCFVLPCSSANPECRGTVPHGHRCQCPACPRSLCGRSNQKVTLIRRIPVKIQHVLVLQRMN